MNETVWESLSPAQKKQQLYDNPNRLPDEFLSHGTISKAQHDMNLGDLTKKIGLKDHKIVTEGWLTPYETH